MSACVEVPWNSAGLVIETGRPVVHVMAEIGVGEQAVGCAARLGCVALGRENRRGRFDTDTLLHPFAQPESARSSDLLNLQKINCQ